MLRTFLVRILIGVDLENKSLESSFFVEEYIYTDFCFPDKQL